MTRVRACNYVKIETGRNFPPVLQIVTRTEQLRKMLMLLSMHVTSVLFLVRFNDFTLTIGVIRSYSSCPLLCTLVIVNGMNRGLHSSHM